MKYISNYHIFFFWYKYVYILLLSKENITVNVAICTSSSVPSDKLKF